MTNYSWAERILVWLLTLVFLTAAAAKLTGVPDIVGAFDRFGLPAWMIHVTAAVEILGAIGLHFRRSPIGFAAPALLGGTMIAAAGFHFYFDTPPDAIPALVLLALLALIAYLRRPHAVG